MKIFHESRQPEVVYFAILDPEDNEGNLIPYLEQVADQFDSGLRILGKQPNTGYQRFTFYTLPGEDEDNISVLDESITNGEQGAPVRL